MLNNGMSLVDVSKYLGHSSPTITARKYLGHSSPTITAQIYAHVMPGGLEKAVGIFDNVAPSKV